MIVGRVEANKANCLKWLCDRSVIYVSESRNNFFGKKTMRYEAINPVSRQAAENATSSVELPTVLLAVALYEVDRDWAEQFCLLHARHPSPAVRGSALLGLGHLARRFRDLDRSQVEPVLQAGLADENAWVRGQAESARDDIAFFLG
jgi:hypothetical protein